MRDKVRGADEELREVAPDFGSLDGIDVPQQSRIKRPQHGNETDGGDHRLHEIERHELQHAGERRANAQGVDLTRRNAVLADEVLELPGDQPVDQADADGEGGVEEWEENVAKAQKIAAALVGVALGGLRLDGCPPPLEVQ